MLEDIPFVRRISFVHAENDPSEQELPYSIMRPKHFCDSIVELALEEDSFMTYSGLHVRANAIFTFIEEMECGGVKKYGKLRSDWNTIYLDGLVHPFMNGVTGDYSDINNYRG